MNLPIAPVAPAGPQGDAMGLAPNEGGAEAMPEGGMMPGHLSSQTGQAVTGGMLPGVQLDAELTAQNAWAQGHAETAQWGNPADELAAGGQHRALAEMARDAARSLAPAVAAGEALSNDERLATRAPHAEAAPPDASVAARWGADAVMPGSPLVPHILTALHPGAPTWRWREPDDMPHRTRRSPWPQDDAADRGDPDEAMEQGDEEASPSSRGIPAEAVDAADEPASWCRALVDVLRREASEAGAQAALQIAATTWLRGRAVLLACPANAADASSACLFLLRRRRSAAASDSVLVGERFAARLRWARPPVERRWWAVRVAKRHVWPRGAQLVTLDGGEGTSAGVPCEIQLGPIAAPFARWREVLVRVDAAQRLWSALGVQWSLPLLVCSQALLADIDSARWHA